MRGVGGPHVWVVESEVHTSGLCSGDMREVFSNCDEICDAFTFRLRAAAVSGATRGDAGFDMNGAAPPSSVHAGAWPFCSKDVFGVVKIFLVQYVHSKKVVSNRCFER
jgi:hypothetical protein